MTHEEISQFRQKFRSIVYASNEVKKKEFYIKQLCIWDKNGSHNNAILNAIEQLKLVRNKLKDMLEEKSYDEWKVKSKEITALTRKIGIAKSKIEKYEFELNNLGNPKI
jgi:hypothetical protein